MIESALYALLNPFCEDLDSPPINIITEMTGCQEGRTFCNQTLPVYIELVCVCKMEGLRVCFLRCIGVYLMSVWRNLCPPPGWTRNQFGFGALNNSRVVRRVSHAILVGSRHSWRLLFARFPLPTCWTRFSVGRMLNLGYRKRKSSPLQYWYYDSHGKSSVWYHLPPLQDIVYTAFWAKLMLPTVCRRSMQPSESYLILQILRKAHWRSDMITQELLGRIGYRQHVGFVAPVILVLRRSYVATMQHCQA